MASDRLTEALRGGLPGLPAWMPRPGLPAVDPVAPWRARVVDQLPTGQGDVLVTFLLPGMVRATVRVPQSAWIEGHHLALGPALTTLAQPPPAPSPTATNVQDGVQDD